MFENFFSFLEFFDDILWGYLAFPAILLTGLVLTVESGFVQIRKFPYILKTFISFFLYRSEADRGIHPLKAFFACVGGCVGLGNIVCICTAVQIGGPGALFWIWISAVFGMIVKYAEVFLGIKYRVSNAQGGYNGGPMFYLQKVFKTKFFPLAVCLLLCVYGVEVLQFRIVTTNLAHNLQINESLIAAVLLAVILLSCAGGIQRVGTISSVMIPVFVVLYLCMGFWVLLQNASALPDILKTVFASAFSSHAATGGFVGSSLLLTISQGMRRGCYTGDVGIGYASVIHSESSIKNAQQQASLVIFDIFLDTIVICSTSLLMILATGIWKAPISTGIMVQTALSRYFPYMDIYMPFFIFLVGVSTINAYFCVGLKCADFLLPRYGKKIFYTYAIGSMILFSFFEIIHAQIFMSVTGGLLLMLNLHGIFRLRHEVEYNIGEDTYSLQIASA